MKKIFYILTLFVAIAFAGCEADSTFDELPDGDKIPIPTNEIHYTSAYVIWPYTEEFPFGEGVEIVSNVCENGQGIITFNKEVTKIGDWAFEGCTSLTSITIPDSVTKIGAMAFYNCTSFEGFYCKAVNPPAMWFYSDNGNYYFSLDNNVAGRKIYVPCESIEAYKTDNIWSTYANDIVGYDF